jgi:signal transduction histidine kinase
LQYLKQYRYFLLSISVLIVAVVLTYLLSVLSVRSIEHEWEKVSALQNDRLKEEAMSLFDRYKANVLGFSDDLLKDKKLVGAIVSQNVRKSFEYLSSFENLKYYNVEVYNPRFEKLLYYGRHLNPDVTELARGFAGETFFSVKEIGFFTYLLVYRPVLADTSDAKGSGRVAGILIVSQLLDVDYPLKNKFFKGFGITSEVAYRTGVNAEFDFSAGVHTGKHLLGSPGEIDSSLLKENNVYYFTGTGNEAVGLIYAPKPDKVSYVEDVAEKYAVWIAIELFVISCIALTLVFWMFKNFKPQTFFGRNYFLKTIIVLLMLVGVRYFWLLIGFPQKIIDMFNVSMFSPSFYASTFAFGIARSNGEILTTSILLLIFCFYMISEVIAFCRRDPGQDSRIRKDTSPLRILLHASPVLLGLLIIFGSIQAYGHILSSIVFDSNLKFFDKLQVISTDQPELLLVQFTVVLISISLVIAILSGALLINRTIAMNFQWGSFLARHCVLYVFGALILLNSAPNLVVDLNAVFTLNTGLRNLILILTGLYAYYFYGRMTSHHNYSYVGLLNVSLTLLICAGIIPEALLSKITSQENKYIELMARKLSEQATDKATFMLASNLEDINDDATIGRDVTDKNKFRNLAFRIWSESKLSSENFNSAVYVLDTAKQLISDFSTNPSGLSADSVIRFVLKKGWTHAASGDEEMSDEQGAETDVQEEAFEDLGMEGVFENPELKYFYGVCPIGRGDPRTSIFRNVIGYVLMVVQYDSRKYFSQSGSDLFSDFGKDNLVNKLISPPVISEFSNGELVGSSDREVSKSFIKSIDAFREQVKDKIDKSSWRYDQFEGTNYKSFYTLSTSTGGIAREGIIEKVFVVSSRVSDFGANIFFTFKNLIFLVFVYTWFLLGYAAYRLPRYFRLAKKSRGIIFGYREKLFAAFFFVSVIPVIILAAYTRQFVENKNAEFYNEQLISDLKIVNQYITNKIPPPDVVKRSSAQLYLADSANVFGKGFPESHKNFNLFVKGKLVSTTNEELYKSGLLDDRLSANAYYNIVLLKKDYYVENQELGDFKFIVGYKPVFDKFGNLLGIVSSQTFFKQYEINEELTESLTYILGTYIVAVIFLIFIVNILSYRISNPVIKLLRATEQLAKGNVDIQVKAESKDEIGELVKSFNKMIRELKRSREELKRAERESAWRDIARQVAHEIKNPLTPIKLAMQHLYRSYTSHPKEFQSVLQTTHQMIIEQIESLNRIASEFSDFARMPSRNYQPLAADQVITDAVNLFSSSKVRFQINLSDGIARVLADKDELKRALINVIRNSLQAIEQRDSENFQGKIKIDTHQTDGYYFIKIRDNGIGMDEETLQKLFEPYFSTKSKGMGLGLVITKKIIDEMQGKIFVRSYPDQGTEVEIKLKIFSGSQ